MNFSDPIDGYQRIGNLLAAAVPDTWSEIEVEALRGGDSIDLMILYLDGNGRRNELGYVPGLARAFYNLARFASSPEKGLCKKCLFKIASDGEFKVDFEH